MRKSPTAGGRLRRKSGDHDALRSATSTNAALLRREDLGRIAEGACADLVILDGNPFDEPSVLWDESRTRTVIKAGRIVSGEPAGQAALEESLSGSRA
ncbi:hypothetical protein ARTHROSP310_06720 [Arthrobacter sp. AD-310]